MRELKFLNAELRPGLNLTVRDGTKWATGAYPGEKVALYSVSRSDDGSCETATRIGTGTVITAAFVDVGVGAGGVDGTGDTFQGTMELLNAMLPFEHAEECHTIGGLIDALNRAYGTEINAWGPTLTLLFFTATHIFPHGDA